MSSTDKELGYRVHAHLHRLGIETPMQPPLPERQVNSLSMPPVKNANVKEDIEGHVKEILNLLHLDLRDDSLIKTPHRVAKMFAHEIFYGLDYANFPRCMTIENKMKVDEVVAMKNVLVRSVCEHHLQPFIGVCHIGYIPREKVVGLSKLNRIVDFFCRRPQVQERLTIQIAATLAFILDTDDVAVVIDAEHYCIKLRGVQDPTSSTATSKMSGKFLTSPALRAEFFSLVRG